MEELAIFGYLEAAHLWLLAQGIDEGYHKYVIGFVIGGILFYKGYFYTLIKGVTKWKN